MKSWEGYVKTGRSFKVRIVGNSFQALSRITALTLSMSISEAETSQMRSTKCLLEGLAVDSLRCYRKYGFRYYFLLAMCFQWTLYYVFHLFALTLYSWGAPSEGVCSVSPNPRAKGQHEHVRAVPAKSNVLWHQWHQTRTYYLLPLPSCLWNLWRRMFRRVVQKDIAESQT